MRKFNEKDFEDAKLVKDFYNYSKTLDKNLSNKEYLNNLEDYLLNNISETVDCFIKSLYLGNVKLPSPKEFDFTNEEKIKLFNNLDEINSLYYASVANFETDNLEEYEEESDKNLIC